MSFADPHYRAEFVPLVGLCTETVFASKPRRSIGSETDSTTIIYSFYYSFYKSSTMPVVLKETTKVDLLAFLTSAGLIHELDDNISTDIVEMRVHDVFDYAQERSELLKTLRKDGTRPSYETLTSLPFWNAQPDCEGRVLLRVARDTWEERLGLGYMFKPKEGDRAFPTSVFKELRQTIDSIASAIDQGICNVCLLDDDVKWAISLQVSRPNLFLHYSLEHKRRTSRSGQSVSSSTQPQGPTSPSSSSNIGFWTVSKTRTATCYGSGVPSANALRKRNPKRPNAN